MSFASDGGKSSELSEDQLRCLFLRRSFRIDQLETESGSDCSEPFQFPVHPTMPDHAAFAMAVRRHAFASLMTFS